MGSAAKLATKKPLSSASFFFWIPLGQLGSAALFNPTLVEPTVVRSTGSWPKPEGFRDFTWGTDPATGQVFLDINYVRTGFDPAPCGGCSKSKPGHNK